MLIVSARDGVLIIRIQNVKVNFMQSTTYTDIIDGKIAEWQEQLKKVEKQADKASSDISSADLKDLRNSVNTAIAQLRSLDAQETADNTMATKDEILKIFRSIDTQFTEFVENSPFML